MSDAKRGKIQTRKSVVEKLALNTELEPQTQDSCAELFRKSGILTAESGKKKISGWQSKHIRIDGWKKQIGLICSFLFKCPSLYMCASVCLQKHKDSFSFGGPLPISKAYLIVSNFSFFDLSLFTQVCNSLVESWIRVKSHIALKLSQLSAEAQHSEITTGVGFSYFSGTSNILLPSSIWDFQQVALLSLS